MNEILNISAYFVLARAVHFAACLIIFNICVFDRIIIRPTIGEAWSRIAQWLLAIALPVTVLSGIGWFLAVAVQMSDPPLRMDVVRTVWSQTRFGLLWQLRSILCLLTLIAALSFFLRQSSRPRTAMKWMATIFSCLLLLSLAWAGHGGDGRFPRAHLLADVLHLLAAGFWPTGLLPLLLLLLQLRKSADENRMLSMIALVRRFSLVSIAAVALLLLSGMANSYFLLDNFSDLLFTTYGRVLLVKIILFILMVAIGAVNLLVLKPRLPASASRLRWNVSAELILGSALLIVTAILGLLPPALH